MRSVTCPDCGAQVELPVVTVGDESILVQCPRCLWHDLDALYGARGLVVWGGSVAEMACWTCVPPGAGLQAAINSAPTGSIVTLQQGIYTGNINVPLGADIVVLGAGQEKTILTGSVTLPSNHCRFENLWIMGTGQAYGVKLFNATAGPNRHHFTKVRVGGSVSTADGPVGPGVWLDGAILNVFDHCTISFNGGDGVYVNTTDPSSGNFSTNVNTFRDCTVNLNGGYGVKTETGVDGISGMQQHVFLGGNMEDNAHGCAYIDGSFYTRFDNVDFESSINLGASFDVMAGYGGWLFNGSGSTYIIIENCSISSTGNTGRLFSFSSCGSCRVNNNRIRGQFPNMEVGAFDENCYRCTSHGNAWWDPTTSTGTDVVTPRWINNRGQNRGWTQ